MCTHDNICSSIHMQYFLFKLMRYWESVSPWSYFRATASYIVGIEREIVSRRVDECKRERRVLRSQCWARVDCMEPVERPYDIMYTQMTLNIYTKHQVFLFSLDLLWTSSSSSTAGELKDRDGWYIGFPPDKDAWHLHARNVDKGTTSHTEHTGIHFQRSTQCAVNPWLVCLSRNLFLFWCCCCFHIH